MEIEFKQICRACAYWGLYAEWYFVVWLLNFVGVAILNGIICFFIFQLVATGFVIFVIEINELLTNVTENMYDDYDKECIFNFFLGQEVITGIYYAIFCTVALVTVTVVFPVLILLVKDE